MFVDEMPGSSGKENSKEADLHKPSYFTVAEIYTQPIYNCCSFQE